MQIQLNPILFPVVASLLILLFSIIKWFQKPSLKASPRKLPIMGNLHQLSTLAHHDLHRLSKVHGPLMLLHFGSVPVLIVSSAGTAREIMRTHDLTFANRPLYKAFKKIVYNGKDVAFAPYGDYWKQMRSVFDVQLLGTKRIEASRFIREEETALLMKKIAGFTGQQPLNLSKMFNELTNDAICRSAFGNKYSDSKYMKGFLKVLSELMGLIGLVDIGDFIPWLGWINHVNGVNNRLNRVSKLMDGMMESFIEERMEAHKRQDGNKGEDFLDILLEIYSNSDGRSIDIDCIKALLADVFVAGTDSVSSTMEWMMAELLRHPEAMEKLQNEIREITKGKDIITDDDLGEMQYLKAVIKETFRYHPPNPLLVPKLGSKDVKINGYDVLAGTVVMINAVAIGRDPVSWEDPEKFRPERFLNSSIDFKGLDFELIPFGAGRRKCPGINYANATIEYVFANILQKFNWESPGKDLDMKETAGITVRKAVPLLAFASHNV